MTDNERQEIRQALPSYVESITTRTHSKNRYVCPICGSKGNAFVLMRSETWYCHSCHEHGDIFKLIELYEHCDFKDAIERAAQVSGVRLEDPRELSAEERRKRRQEQDERNRERQQAKTTIEDFKQWYQDTYATLCEYKRTAVFDYKGLLPDSDAHRQSSELRLKEVKGYLQAFEDAETYEDIRLLFISSLFHEDIQRYKTYLEFRKQFREDEIKP